jgi:hypothetical protein
MSDLVAAAPRPAVRTIFLEEAWTRGDDDDADVMFGVPTGVVADPAGNVYVVDNQLSEITAFSPDGEVLGTLGREGEGPGEFVRPIGLVLLPDGRIGAGRMIQARFETLTPDGTPAGAFSLGDGGPQEGMTVLYGAACRGGTLLAATATSAFDQTTGKMRRIQNLEVYRPDGSRRAHLRDARISMDFTGTEGIREADVLRSFLIVHAVGPDGRVYVPRTRDEYAIEVYTPDGALERVIARPDFAAPPRTARERARLEALADSWARNAGLDLDIEFSPSEMTIGGLFVDDRGHLFVEHAASRRDLPAGAFLRLDEFGPDGADLGPVLLRGPGDPDMDTLVWLGGERVAILRGGVLTGLERWRDAAIEWQDEDEVVPSVTVCRLRRATF